MREHLGKKLGLICLALALSGTAQAEAMSFSTYFCIFARPVGETDWFGAIGWGDYDSTLGWNQGADVMASLTVGNTGASLASCAHVTSSSPDELSMSISYVAGQGVEFADDSVCAFGGAELNYTTKTSPLTTTNTYEFARQTQDFETRIVEFINVLGIRPTFTEGDPEVLCRLTLAEIEGAGSRIVRGFAQMMPEMRFRRLPGQRMRAL